MLLKILKTFLISTTPIGELRAGIPFGIYQGIPSILTFISAIAGNMVPVFFLLWGLPKAENFLDQKINKKSLSNKIYYWYCEKTKKKHTKRFKRLGALALITFVAIPLPITGAWTGSLAAHIFKIPPKKALPLIFLGIIIAGIIILLLTLQIK